MSLSAGGIALAAVLALLLGIWLMRAGGGMRLRRGLGSGETVSLDQVTLTSRRLGLIGRPDRLIRTGGTVIVEEWKSSKSVWPNHRAQMGVYFLLVEDHWRVKPSHGFLVTGDGTRHRVENCDDLRSWVLVMVGKIRAARVAVNQPIPVNPRPGQCRSCGQHPNCDQART